MTQDKITAPCTAIILVAIIIAVNFCLSIYLWNYYGAHERGQAKEEVLSFFYKGSQTVPAGEDTGQVGGAIPKRGTNNQECPILSGGSASSMRNHKVTIEDAGQVEGYSKKRNQQLRKPYSVWWQYKQHAKP